MEPRLIQKFTELEESLTVMSAARWHASYTAHHRTRCDHKVQIWLEFWRNGRTDPEGLVGARSSVWGEVPPTGQGTGLGSLLEKCPNFSLEVACYGEL